MPQRDLEVPYRSTAVYLQLNVIRKADELKRGSIEVEVCATFSSEINKGVFVN